MKADMYQRYFIK